MSRPVLASIDLQALKNNLAIVHALRMGLASGRW